MTKEPSRYAVLIVRAGALPYVHSLHDLASQALDAQRALKLPPEATYIATEAEARKCPPRVYVYLVEHHVHGVPVPDPYTGKVQRLYAHAAAQQQADDFMAQYYGAQNAARIGVLDFEPEMWVDYFVPHNWRKLK